MDNIKQEISKNKVFKKCNSVSGEYHEIRNKLSEYLKISNKIDNNIDLFIVDYYFGGTKKRSSNYTNVVIFYMNMNATNTNMCFNVSLIDEEILDFLEYCKDTELYTSAKKYNL